MYLLKKLLILVLLLIILPENKSYAQLIDTIHINPDFLEEQIGTKCYYRTGNQFELFDKNKAHWKPFGIPFHQFELDSTHWMYSVVKNNDSFDKTLKLFINNVQAANLKLYLISDGKIDSSQITGSMTPIDLRSTKDRPLSFYITLASKKTTDIYIRQSRRLANITIIPVLVDPGKSQFSNLANNLSFISVFILILILIATLFLLISYYSTENLWLFIHMFFAFLYVCAAFGYGSLYLWPSHPNFEENAAIFLGNISSATFFEFSRRALMVKQRFPKISIIVLTFSICHTLLGVYGFSFYGTSKATFHYINILGLFFLGMLLIEVILFIIAIIQSTQKQNREFLWFVGIFFFGLFYNTFAVFIELGKIPYSYNMQVWLLPTGVIPQMFLIFIFLVRKAMKLLKEKEKKITETKLTAENELLNERLRMSKNLHDDIGAELSGINLYSHLAKQQSSSGNISDASNSISIIQDSTTKVIERLREIVWDITPHETESGNLIEKINLYTKYISKPSSISFQFIYDKVFEENVLPAKITQNLFLICKEAINNAVKYSECSNIKISLTSIENKLELCIRDNGKGFDVHTVEKGNGLKNIEKRMQDIGGECLISASRGNGCSITVQSHFI